MGKALGSFVADLKEKIEAERAFIVKFAADIVNDPLTVLSWDGASAFTHAARIRVFSRIVLIVEATQSDRPDAEVLARIKAEALKSVLRAVTASPSTNPTANLADKAEGAAWAEVLEFLNFTVFSPETKS